MKIFWPAIFLVFGISGSAAFAADAVPPEFVPIVVDRAQYNSALSYLGGLKYSDAAPIVKWLSELEGRAIEQWKADNAAKSSPKSEEAPK
jgi:hypothetical protein